MRAVLSSRPKFQLMCVCVCVFVIQYLLSDRLPAGGDWQRFLTCYTLKGGESHARVHALEMYIHMAERDREDTKDAIFGLSIRPLIVSLSRFAG